MRWMNVLFFGNFGDYWQCGEGGMVGVSEYGYKSGYQWGKEGNVFWVVVQYLFGEVDQVIYFVGDLYGGDSGNYCYNDFNNVEGDCIWFNLKNKCQDKDVKVIGKVDIDVVELGVEINCQQDNNQFCIKYICFFCFLIS